MLCPEIWNFPSPKVFSSFDKFINVKGVEENINLNNFYNSVIITCPDEIYMPKLLEETLVGDSDYYKVSNCSLSEFLDPIFIQSFIKTGKLYCLTVEKDCITQNCASITPDGVLTLHILESIFQTLGLQGIKRPHGFMEVKINLIYQQTSKLKNTLDKLEKFDFYIVWEPNEEDICPSSIAKYFSDRNLVVSNHSLEIKRITPTINKIPSIKDVEIDSIVEWIGMLAHDGDISPKECYISTYKEPESSMSMITRRLSISIVKGFLTAEFITCLAQIMSDYVNSRDINNYWACMSIQSIHDSLWRWDKGRPCKFQSHNSSSNMFFTHEDICVYSIGQINFS